MRMIKRLGNFVGALFKGLWRAFDIRDILVEGGLLMLGYGLYLKWGLWLGLMVCGIILFSMGFLWPAFLSLTAKRAK